MFNAFWTTSFGRRFHQISQRFHLSALMPEFWLPLPLLGICFWVIGGLIAEQLLNNSFSSVTPLGNEVQFDIQPPVNFLEIRATLDRAQGITHIEAIQVDLVLDSAPKSIVLEVPTTEFEEVEGAIAQRLKIPLETVRSLVSYRLQN